MAPLSLVLALSILPAPQATVTPRAPAPQDPVRVLAIGLAPGVIHAVRAVPIGPAVTTDCTERRAVAVRADRRGRLRAVLDPAWRPGRRSRSAHDIADAWCARAYRVTVRRGGQRRAAARASFRVAPGPGA